MIQGAKIAGVGEIIAIDMIQHKLDLANQFGATARDQGRRGRPRGPAIEPPGRGADTAFEVIGLGATMEQAINMTRTGGEAVLVGVPRLDVFLNLHARRSRSSTLTKTVKGCWYGSSNVNQDVPKLIELYQSGQLELDELISREIGLEDVNEAFAAMETGEVARSVIIYD